MGDGIDCPAVTTIVIAYHEAGHAVAQLLVSPPLPLTEVTIVPKGDNLGQACFEDYGDLIVPDTDGEDAEVSEHWRQYLDSEAISSLAGPLAEQRFRGETLGPPLPASAGADQAHVHAIARFLYEDLREADMWQWWMLHRAVRLVEVDADFWAAVVTVAGALLRESSLSESEVAQLVHGG